MSQQESPLPLHPLDLSPGLRWLNGQSAQQRKQLGQWSTPWWLVAHAVQKLAPSLKQGAVILDPAVGDGRWLIALGALRPDLVLIGVDRCAHALDAARESAQSAGIALQLRHADFLSEPPFPVDLVVGNPPYVRPQNLLKTDRERYWSQFSCATNKADLYACFVEHALAHSRRVAFVLPDNWLHIHSFAALRRHVDQRGVHAIYSLPKRTFKPARVQTVLLLTGSHESLSGHLNESGFSAGPGLDKGPHAWSLDGPLPQLTGRPLGDLVHIHMGVVCGDYPRYLRTSPRCARDKATLRGRDVLPWRLAPTREYLHYDPADMLRRKPYVAPKSAKIFDVPEKIIVAGSSGTVLRAAMDTKGRFPLDSCYIILPKTPEVTLYAVLGLLLSQPVNDWYGRRHRAPRVKAIELKRIPIPAQGLGAIDEAARRHDIKQVERAVQAAYSKGH